MTSTLSKRIETMIASLTPDEQPMATDAIEFIRAAGPSGLKRVDLVSNLVSIYGRRGISEFVTVFAEMFSFCIVLLPGSVLAFTTRGAGEPEDALAAFCDDDDQETRTHVRRVSGALAMMDGASFRPAVILKYLCDQGMDGLEATVLLDSLMTQFRAVRIDENRSQLPHMRRDTTDGFEMLHRWLNYPYGT